MDNLKNNISMEINQVMKRWYKTIWKCAGINDVSNVNRGLGMEESDLFNAK
jgi:hypothetical protein